VCWFAAGPLFLVRQQSNLIQKAIHKPRLTLSALPLSALDLLARYEQTMIAGASACETPRSGAGFSDWGGGGSAGRWTRLASTVQLGSCHTISQRRTRRRKVCAMLYTLDACMTVLSWTYGGPPRLGGTRLNARPKTPSVRCRLHTSTRKGQRRSPRHRRDQQARAGWRK